MCGIAGKVSFTAKPITELEISGMNDSIKHRGPDDGGVYISPDRKVGLGNRRLSIIDLSPKGHMPMSYKNRYWITYNGEIYNFHSERNKLQKLGYRFISQSDTEVILALYDKYGVHCLDHLRGMFAFAIYDSQKNILFCARDRVGKKPFKYFHNANTFIFASELKAILTQSEYHKEPDHLAIYHYLTLQYCPAPLTGFVGINKLEPGSYLLLDIVKNQLVKNRYWNLDFSQKLNLSESEWCDRIMSKLEEAVKLRMISDVPLGAFLSGGIDSSAVVATMAQNSSRPVKTFSIGFEEAKFNELPYARIVAERFKTDHTEFIVKPETIEILPYLVRQYEEPYADSSALATYYVSKLTRDKVTVALNGDGGDENFAGYPWYLVHNFSLFYEKFHALNNVLVQPFWSALYRCIPSTLTERGLRFSEMINTDYAKRYIDYIAYFTTRMKNDLLKPGFISDNKLTDTNLLIADKFRQSSASDKMDQAFYTDINSYLPDDLMVKVDIATMANSLEGRSPLLDHIFMQTCAQIPSGLKLKNGLFKKYILKKSLADILPSEILTQPKRGFMIPLNTWFKERLYDYASDILLSEKANKHQMFKQSQIKKLFFEQTHTGINNGNRLWALLTLELWFRTYFD